MFPGATADRAEANYVISGAPLDCSTTFQPGTRFGPDRVRLYSRAFDDYDHHTGLQFTDLSVHDTGDLHAWDDSEEYLEFLEGQLSDVRESGAIPITIGGEHTVTLAGVRACEPDVFVCLDAHLDLHDEFDGNPLSHATVTNHVLSVADHAVILGARTGSESEFERASESDVTVVPPDEVADWKPAAESALDGAGGTQDLYLSVDIDAADPAFAPGTGTKEPFGLSSSEMHEIVRSVAPNCVGFDLVEVNDRDDGQAATLGGKLLRAFVYEHAANSPNVSTPPP